MPHEQPRTESSPVTVLTIPEHRIRFLESSRWREAVRETLSPLVEDKLAEPRYVETILDSVADGSGLYMDLGHGIMLAHSRPENGALGTGLSLGIARQPVFLNNAADHAIRQIWGLCATDSHTHQETMAGLAAVLVNPESRDQIASARTVSDVLTAIAAA